MANGRRKKTEHQKVLKNFSPRASEFGELEESSLHIHIQTINDPKTIIAVPDEGILTNLKDFLLPNYDEAKIRKFFESEQDELNESQRQFLMKLKHVLNNNDPHNEQLIGDLFDHITDQMGLNNDGYKMSLCPSNLRLNIGSGDDVRKYEVDIAKEGRRRKDMIWLIQSHKHRLSNDFKKGDVQLACAMISAFQQNHQIYKRVCPGKILGIKLVGDTLFFASMIISDEYIDELHHGLPHQSVVMHSYPEDGFSLSHPNQRKEALKWLSNLCREGMSI
ncbi:unnamed protein product [Cunninghamella echinulata]